MSTLTFLSLVTYTTYATYAAESTPTPETRWQEAKAVYDAGRLEDALRLYQGEPVETASYFYNIGTLLQQLGRSGQAVAYLEKANRLSPHDSEIRHNLSIARATLGQLIGNDRLDPASTWNETLADQISLEDVRGALGIMVLLLSLAWIRAYLKTRSLKRTFLNPLALVPFLGVILAAGLYVTQRIAEGHPPAVCIERQVVRSGPGDHFLELYQVEAGTKLRLLGPTSAGTTQSPIPSPSGTPSGSPSASWWYQVRYGAGIGWVRASSLLLL